MIPLITWSHQSYNLIFIYPAVCLCTYIYLSFLLLVPLIFMQDANTIPFFPLPKDYSMCFDVIYFMQPELHIAILPYKYY